MSPTNWYSNWHILLVLILLYFTVMGVESYNEVSGLHHIVAGIYREWSQDRLIIMLHNTDDPQNKLIKCYPMNMADLEDEEFKYTMVLKERQIFIGSLYEPGICSISLLYQNTIYPWNKVNSDVPKKELHAGYWTSHKLPTYPPNVDLYITEVTIKVAKGKPSSYIVLPASWDKPGANFSDKQNEQTLNSCFYIMNV